jgi:hypothetical protein
MNILLWILQILLAVWNMIGGMYTLWHYEQLKGPWVNDLPKSAWAALCALQVLFAVGLILPRLTPFAAIYLAFNSLLGCVLFAQFAGFPGMLWGLVPAILAGFVAVGRWR